MNPFRETIVASPWEAPRGDVPAIHRGVFEECLRGIEHVRNSHRSAALLIHGEAGSGKTHLLSRLRGHLSPAAPTATDREECLYVWVRLQSSPRMIWRTVRRTLVNDWFRPVADFRSQFDRILFHRLAEIRVAEGDLEPWYEYMLDEHPAGLKELLDQIAERLYLDRNTAVAFEHIAFGRHRRDLRAWLCGDSLPEAALTRMDLSQDEGTDEEREDQSRQVVLMLCQLAGDELPIVLCFDQVEALQTTPKDPEGLFAFGQLASTLHDGTSNVLIISCVQSSFFNELKDRPYSADYARITSLGALSLGPLSRADAEQLIKARIDGAPDLTAIPGESPCWPLSPDEFEDVFSRGPVTPRRLLANCAEKFEVRTRAEPAPAPAQPTAAGATPGAATREEAVTTFLEDRWRTSVEEKLAANGPEQTEEIIRHGFPLVTALVTPDWKLVRARHLPDVALVFERGASRTGLSVCTQSNMKSLAARLRRLKDQLPELTRLIVVRDSRVPLSSGAKMARSYLEELEREGARIVHPAPEALAALDALRALLSDAKSGDLDCHGEAVAPRSVEEWLRSHLPAGLGDFVDEIFVQPSEGSATDSDARDVEALNTLLADNPVLDLAIAAEKLQRPAEELAAVIRRHPGQLGLLGESPSVLFRVVEESEA
jgi:hypothetical protein